MRVLIRALRGDDGIWYGSAGPPTGGDRRRFPFFPAGDDPARRSPFAGRQLDIDIGETAAPPGWTRFHLESGTFYATDVVCWLLFGADARDCWPLTPRCVLRCG